MTIIVLDEESIKIEEQLKKTESATSVTSVQHIKETTDQFTQTTKNTGYLQFEISPYELDNLNFEKKRILLDFMDAFGLKDDRRVSSIKERLTHRMSNMPPRHH